MYIVITSSESWYTGIKTIILPLLKLFSRKKRGLVFWIFFN